ncbi:MAG: hypothetical protein ACRDQA_17840 [Nocardioidaceae bacterium]
MTDTVKKGVVLLAVAFGVFYLLTQPEGAADAIRGAFGAVKDGADQVVRFFNALAG